MKKTCYSNADMVLTSVEVKLDATMCVQDLNLFWQKGAEVQIRISDETALRIPTDLENWQTKFSGTQFHRVQSIHLQILMGNTITAHFEPAPGAPQLVDDSAIKVFLNWRPA